METERGVFYVCLTHSSLRTVAFSDIFHEVMAILRSRFIFVTYKLVWKFVWRWQCLTLSGLLKAFVFPKERSCDDKWGLPKLAGNSQVILFTLQRDNTSLRASRDRQNYPLSACFHSMHEIFIRYIHIYIRDKSMCYYLKLFVKE